MVCPKCNNNVPENESVCSFCNNPLPPTHIPKKTPDTGGMGDSTPKVIGNRYRIVNEIARGGMGIVYKAHDQQLDMIIAIKVLSPSLAGDRQGLENLKREAKTAMLLSHPNIMRLHNFEEIDNTRFLTMEFIDGETLAKLLIEDKKFSVSETIKFAIQICAGLDYAHQKKVVHRDIKPSNLMLDREGVVKITDFGIAGVVQDTISRVTQTTVAGTLAYMAPERLKGEKTDHRSDIYSLGVVLYEFLAGHPPFYTGGIEYQIIHSQPKPIPDIPASLEDIIRKSLAKKPEDRWDNVRELYNVLNRRKGGAYTLTADDRRVGGARDKAISKAKTGGPSRQFLQYGIIGTLAFLFAIGLIYFLTSIMQKAPMQQAITESKKIMQADLQKKINQLTAKGDEYIEEKSYTTPSYGNAFKTFSEVLKLDPNNSYARKKISWIKDIYIKGANRELGKKARVAGKLDSLIKAKGYFLQALLVEPGDYGLTNKIKELDDQINRMKIELALKAEKAKAEQEAKETAAADVAPYKDMVKVEAGEFFMGTSPANINTIARFFPTVKENANWKKMFSDEICSSGKLKVRLDEFWIDKHEVTNEEYHAFIMANPSWKKSKIKKKYHDGNYLKYWDEDDYPAGKEKHPVVHISWFAANAYARWKGKRLPSEAQWEKAARGAEGQRIWPWGDIWSNINLNSNASGIMDTVPVESYPAGKSPYGAHDMLGNVWEWCNDWYSKNYYNLIPKENPKGPPGGNGKVIRGGSYNSFSSRLHLTNRRYIEPTTASYSIGFRCMRGGPAAN